MVSAASRSSFKRYYVAGSPSNLSMFPACPATYHGGITEGTEHEEFVLNGLVKRRAELAGDIENTHAALRKMVLDLESLDAIIVQFDPDFQVETIKPKAFRPPKDWSNRGQMSRIILSVLRQASEPLTTHDIALQLLISLSARWIRAISGYCGS
jgi:hypothetical protein